MQGEGNNLLRNMSIKEIISLITFQKGKGQA